MGGMWKILLCASLFLACALHASDAAGAAGEGAKSKVYPYRWVFAFGKSLDDDASLHFLEDLADTSAAHGLNGMVLGAGLDNILGFDGAAIERLKKLKAHCDEKKIEIVPLVLSAGYGGGIIKRDPNLSEGLLAKDVLFEVKGHVANVVSENPISDADGSFETHYLDKAKGFDHQDEPGKCTFIDSAVAKDGKVSLRMENFAQNKGRVRLVKSLPVPNRHYVVRLWAKAEGLGKAPLSACVYDGDEQITRLNFHLKDGADWQKIEFSINTLDSKEGKLFLGSWDAKGGKLWLDGLQIFEPGLVNVLRRPGTPFTVVKDGGTETFQEGADFERVEDKEIAPAKPYHVPPSIRLTEASRLKEGDRLRVSYYTSGASALEKREVVLCMSEPKVFEIWKEVIGKVNDCLHPKIWMLDMDEIRGGGTCEACKNRKAADGSRMTCGQILGDCVTRQVQLIRNVSPNAEVAIWNDMFDPLANAGKQYYSAPGGYTGSWNFIPHDLIVVPWLLELSDKSIAHFSKLGHKIVAGAYYDTDDLEGCKQWLASLGKSPNSAGIMYTTWEMKYKLLGPFGDLVNQK